MPRARSGGAGRAIGEMHLLGLRITCSDKIYKEEKFAIPREVDDEATGTLRS
jgi:hypothetical protein